MSSSPFPTPRSYVHVRELNDVARDAMDAVRPSYEETLEYARQARLTRLRRTERLVQVLILTFTAAFIIFEIVSVLTMPLPVYILSQCMVVSLVMVVLFALRMDITRVEADRVQRASDDYEFRRTSP
jgi:hypothetical protein